MSKDIDLRIIFLKNNKVINFVDSFFIFIIKVMSKFNMTLFFPLCQALIVHK